jgi:hypothetical protein
MTNYEDKLQQLKLRMVEAYQRDPSYIGKGRHHWAQRLPHVEGVTFEDWLMLGFESFGVFGEAIADALKPAVNPSVKGWVANNRWIARCECGGQETIDPEDPRFYCWACFNFLTGGRTRKVDCGNWKRKERIFLDRPYPLNRCTAVVQNNETLKWEPLEDVPELEAENTAHGIPARGGR